jgi:hypothetical protein
MVGTLHFQIPNQPLQPLWLWCACDLDHRLGQFPVGEVANSNGHLPQATMSTI